MAFRAATGLALPRWSETNEGRSPMKITHLAVITAALLVAACGSDPSPAESTADNLEEAADQSTPEAAAVLDNAAEQIRDQNVQDPAAAQGALEAAGNAQAGNVSGPATSNGH